MKKLLLASFLLLAPVAAHADSGDDWYISLYPANACSTGSAFNDQVTTDLGWNSYQDTPNDQIDAQRKSGNTVTPQTYKNDDDDLIAETIVVVTPSGSKSEYDWFTSYNACMAFNQTLVNGN